MANGQCQGHTLSIRPPYQQTMTVNFESTSWTVAQLCLNKQTCHTSLPCPQLDMCHVRHLFWNRMSNIAERQVQLTVSSTPSVCFPPLSLCLSPIDNMKCRVSWTDSCHLLLQLRPICVFQQSVSIERRKYPVTISVTATWHSQQYTNLYTYIYIYMYIYCIYIW